MQHGTQSSPRHSAVKKESEERTRGTERKGKIKGCKNKKEINKEGRKE
jgi:hypothetical protein